MSSNCPFCGSNKVNKTFNFNEYTCELCECDYKLTTDGIRIFQEGSWAAFCNSITESVSSKTDASVIDLISKSMRGYSKTSASEIDLVIETLTSIASTLNSEMKAGLRNKNDFLVVMEQVDTCIRAAHALYNRQKDLGIRVKLSENVMNWFDDADTVEEGSMSDLDVIAQEVVQSLGERAAEDESVIAYIQENHPDEVEHINIILQAVHNNINNGEEGISEDQDPFAANDGSSNDTDANNDSNKDASVNTDEDPFASNSDTTSDSDADNIGDEDGGDVALGGDDMSANVDVIADVQDAAETVQDKFQRLEGKIDDLLNKVQNLTGETSSESTDSGDETVADDSGEDPFATDETESTVEGGDNTSSAEGGESSNVAKTEGGDTDVEDPFAESVVNESTKRKSKKIGVTTTRGDKTKASYQRKQSSPEAHAETEEDGEDRTDMNAEVQEEEIPFTEGPKNQMKNTESNAPGATKKPTGEVSYREGFNGFRIGDEVILEGSVDTWNILEIQKNVFTLGRGKSTTKIDIFKECVRHVDSRLEWQATNELMGESKNVWGRVAANYVTDKEEKVTGVVGLGGGNRIGGQKFGSGEELSESTKIPVIETLATDRKEVYKFVKDNALHRLAREIAVQRVCERFTNPIEEIHNIVDDAVLSEDATQVESIDSQYGYKAAPIGEHALRQAFQSGWQSVVESEAKEAKPAPKKVVKESRGVGYYRTEDDKLIDGLGRTAADRLMGR